MGLDKGWAATGARPLVSFAPGRVAGEQVAAIDLHSREAVSRGAGRHRAATDLAIERNADRVPVVLAYEDDGQVVDAGEVHAFVDLALVGGSLAEGGHRHRVVAPHPGPQPEANGMEHLRAHRGADAQDVVRRGPVVARHLAAA